MRAAAAIPVLLVLGACASPRDRSTALEVPSGGYAPAFEAAKQVLIDARFELDRVDARSGVITTRPKETSGLATPWDTEQSSFGQELEDLLNRQYRRVRLTFEPATPAGPAPPAPTDEPGPDLRDHQGPITAIATVSLERLHRPGWRIETTSIRQSSTYYNPEWGIDGIWPQYTVPFAQDHRLAARLTQRIRKRMEHAEAAPATAP